MEGCLSSTALCASQAPRPTPLPASQAPRPTPLSASPASCVHPSPCCTALLLRKSRATTVELSGAACSCCAEPACPCPCSCSCPCSCICRGGTPEGQTAHARPPPPTHTCSAGMEYITAPAPATVTTATWHRQRGASKQAGPSESGFRASKQAGPLEGLTLTLLGCIPNPAPEPLTLFGCISKKPSLAATQTLTLPLTSNPCILLTHRPPQQQLWPPSGFAWLLRALATPWPHNVRQTRRRGRQWHRRALMY